MLQDIQIDLQRNVCNANTLMNMSDRAREDGDEHLTAQLAVISSDVRGLATEHLFLRGFYMGVMLNHHKDSI